MLAMTERKYLPTFAELCDRLSIVLLKQIFIPENREAYIAERKLIEQDIQALLQERYAGNSSAIDNVLGIEDIVALMMLMLTNRFIWENEAKARQGNSEQDHLLKITHAVNGTRNRIKNLLAERAGERKDLKKDCLADFGPQTVNLGLHGNWNVFDDIGIP